MEHLSEHIEDEQDKSGQKHSAHFIRHSKAGYQTYKKILKSGDPMDPVDVENQVTPDLPPEGVEFARQEAERFFTNLDPERDELFLVSSSEARALETANIYKEIAKERGFVIHKPEHVRGKLAEKIGGGDVRVVDALSLNIKNTLVSAVFNPDSRLGEISLKSLSPEAAEKWKQARAIIDSDDRGSWGANFYTHSEKIQRIFPEIKSARDVYESKFQQMIRLAEFGFRKAQKVGGGKSIKILAFGHEEQIGYALNEYFSDHEIKNCEAITIEGDGRDFTIERRGEKRTLDR